MEGRKKVKDQLPEEDISLFNYCFVFSSDTLENSDSVSLFLHFTLAFSHPTRSKIVLCFLHFAVSMDKTVPKSKVPSNWQGINGWQTFWEWFPCQGIGTSLGKAVLNITIHTRFLSNCWLQPAKLLLLQFERLVVRLCKFWSGRSWYLCQNHVLLCTWFIFFQSLSIVHAIPGGKNIKSGFIFICLSIYFWNILVY